MNLIKKIKSLQFVISPKLKWVGGMIAETIRVRGQVYCVLSDALSGEIKQIITAPNLVTDAGDVWHAERVTGDTLTNNFETGIIGLGSAGAAPADASTRANITTKIAGSELAFDGTYPQTNDPDGDNPGSVAADVGTYRRSYSTTQGNDGAIDRLYITNSTPGVSEPLLMYSVIASFAKTTADTLKVYVNHTFN